MDLTSSMPGNEVGDRLHNFFAQENQAQMLDGNWPSLNNNPLVGSQRQIGVLGLNQKSYNLQQPVDTGRGPGSHLLQNQQQHYNEYMYVHEGNVASPGSSFYESQQGFGPEHRTHTPVRSEASESPGSFDLFGSQHQFSSHQSNMLQPSQHQQSGFNIMQQQVMMMKIQELQRQQLLQQLSAREQNALNQISPFPMNSGGLSYPLASETGNTNWLQRNSPVLQGSSNGLISTNRVQGQNLMGLIPQQSDQSLYGVPVSSQMMIDRAYVQKTDSFSGLFPGAGNQYFELPDQVSGHDRALNSKQKFQGENIFGNAPSESLNSTVNMENLQQMNPTQRSTAVQESQLTGSWDSQPTKAASSHDDVCLDPTEEKILFGSDDNIWAAFGKSNDLTGETGNLVDGTGTWSALMQSAVAETSSADAQPQEEWSGLNISSSEPVRPPDENVNDRYNNFQGFQQSGHKIPHGLQTSSPQRLVPPFGEVNKWMETGSLQSVGGVHGGASYKADPGPIPAVDLQPARSSAGISRQRSSSEAHLFGVEFHEEQSHLPSSQQINIVESSSTVLGCQGDQDATNLLGDVQGEIKDVKPQMSRNIGPFQKLNESQGDATIKTISDASPVMSSKPIQTDIETFGQSLNQKKREPYGNLGDQQISHASPPADCGMFGLPGPVNPQQGSVPSLDMPANNSSVIREHFQITPQMAQSWFNRYGTSKNGQTLNEAQKAAAMQIAEPPFTFGKSSSLHAINSMQQVFPANIDRSQQSNVGTCSLPTPAPVEHSPSSQPLSVDMIGQPSIPRPKKRMRVTEDLSPWCKVVSQDLEGLQSSSSGYSEQDWAKATNRVTEKVEGEMGLTEVPPRHKARKRLILTTQLMQQLFHPPPASTLSADSKLAFESVAYLVCRPALGSACGLVSSSKRSTHLAKEDDDKESLSNKSKTSEGTGDWDFSKIVEEFTERKRKLEDEFLKLEKRASVLDLTLESQELEKFSVINRFAKYYGRAQVNALSSADATARTHKAMPQRYVTAHAFNTDHLPTGVPVLIL